MDPIVKKILIGGMFVILIAILAAVIINATKKEEPKKQETKIVTPEPEPEKDKPKDNIDDQDIIVDPPVNDPEPEPEPVNPISKTVKCTYEGSDYNVVWEKSYVNFNLGQDNRILTREDVREYKFEKVNIDEYINNKTLQRIANTLDTVKGVSSKLETIDEADHTYRFTTIFDFSTIDLDELYNKYYKIFFTGDIEMTKEDFYARYKSLSFEDMSKAYTGTGYVCNS